MPARSPITEKKATAHKTAAGLPVATATPIEGELVTLKAATPKAGFLTSEFWATLGTVVTLLLPLFHVVAAPATVKTACVAAGALVTAVYAIVRSNVKTAHLKQAGALPPIGGETGASAIGVVLFVLIVLLLAGVLGAVVHHAFFLLVILLLLLFFA